LHFASRDAELNQLKMLVEQLADKVNARGDTPEERLAAIENRVDEVATHGIRLGTTFVTPVFLKKTKCKPICMPGSSFMHIADISE
jgi:hypothetical protein